jgi:hypothetical protein
LKKKQRGVGELQGESIYKSVKEPGKRAEKARFKGREKQTKIFIVNAYGAYHRTIFPFLVDFFHIPPCILFNFAL